MILPYAAESYPLQVRGRATGWVAACTKAGGLAAQLLSLLGLVPGLGWAAVLALWCRSCSSLFLVVRYRRGDARPRSARPRRARGRLIDGRGVCR